MGAIDMMTKEEAKKWGQSLCKDGTYPERYKYLKQYSAGTIAQDNWNNPLFTLGIEYGVLIAIAKIYGDLRKD